MEMSAGNGVMKKKLINMIMSIKCLNFILWCTINHHFCSTPHLHDLFMPSRVVSGIHVFSCSLSGILSHIFSSQFPKMRIKLEECEPQPNIFCWTCAKGNTNIRCPKCPRQYHDACVTEHRDTDWICMMCTAGGIMCV